MHTSSRRMGLTLLFFILDQASKYLLYDREMMSQVFTPIINTGAARSLPIPPLVIALVGAGMTIWIIKTYYQTPHTHLILAGSLIIAGIWGNLFDRLLYTGVRDFIYVADRYPIFNLADAFLTVGVLIILWHEFTTQKTITGQDKTNP